MKSKMLVDGWITLDQIKLVEKYMVNISHGNILEVGSAAGRLYSYLYEKFTDWNYVSVDPWEKEGVKLQLDWNKGYFEPNNLGELITEQMFKNNCPFATTHKLYYSEYQTNEKFNIISLGLIGSKIDWPSTIEKSFNLLIEGGVIVGRNLSHPKYGEAIKRSIENYRMLEVCNGCYVIGK